VIAIWVVAWVAFAAIAPAARAQVIVPRPRLEEALARTDQRITAAMGLVAGAARSDAEAELASARELQGAARIAIHGPARPRVVMDLTLRARDHADRAIAMVRGLPDPDRVMAQLVQTRDGVDRAGQLITGCPDSSAHELLSQATDMQGLAESAARQDRYLAALQLTFGARERMQQALGACHQVEDLPTAAQQAVTRTDQVVIRARDSVGSQDGPAQQALQRAQQMQTQAQEQQRASQHEAAMRLTFGARANALRAMRLSARPPARATPPAASQRPAPAPAAPHR
jgi:hypothetical protein